MSGARHGTYEGHALAGAFLLIWGSWWILNFLQRFYASYANKVRSQTGLESSQSSQWASDEISI